MLADSDKEFFYRHGYLHVPGVFSPEETRELGEALDWIIGTWATRSSGWSGPWRQRYMTAEVEKRSELVALHDLQFYSSAWCRAVTHARLTEAVSDLLGPDVELHHSTLHVKPPETGHPFPMHQDDPFYPHTDGRSLGMGVGLRRDGESVRESGDFRERALRDCCRQRPPKYLPAHAREIFIMRIFGRKSKRYDSRDSALCHAASERAS